MSKAQPVSLDKAIFDKLFCLVANVVFFINQTNVAESSGAQSQKSASRQVVPAMKQAGVGRS